MERQRACFLIGKSVVLRVTEGETLGTDFDSLWETLGRMDGFMFAQNGGTKSITADELKEYLHVRTRSRIC